MHLWDYQLNLIEEYITGYLFFLKKELGINKIYIVEKRQVIGKLFKTGNCKIKYQRPSTFMWFLQA